MKVQFLFVCLLIALSVATEQPDEGPSSVPHTHIDDQPITEPEYVDGNVYTPDEEFDEPVDINVKQPEKPIDPPELTKPL
jgi:hypothetical protein